MKYEDSTEAPLTSVSPRSSVPVHQRVYRWSTCKWKRTQPWFVSWCYSNTALDWSLVCWFCKETQKWKQFPVNGVKSSSTLRRLQRQLCASSPAKRKPVHWNQSHFCSSSPQPREWCEVLRDNCVLISLKKGEQVLWDQRHLCNRSQPRRERYIVVKDKWMLIPHVYEHLCWNELRDIKMLTPIKHENRELYTNTLLCWFTILLNDKWVWYW